MNPAIWILPVVAAAVDTGATPRPDAKPCEADSAYARVPVYIRPAVAARVDTLASPSLLLIAESVATRIRAALGAPPEAVPRGDTLVVDASAEMRRDTTLPPTWNRIDGSGVRVVAHRDGSLRWAPMQAQPSRFTTVIDRALTDARQADETFIPGDQFVDDSIVFTLDYVRSFTVAGGRVHPVALGPASMVAFTVRAAAEKQAAAVPGTIRVQYPAYSLEGRAEGVVILQYIVDTTGRAEASTVHDLWPKDRPRPTGDLGAYYRAFFEAAKSAVVRARYYPAEIAGCKVRQLVQQPFTYNVAGAR